MREAHEVNAQIRQKFMRDFYNEKTVKKMGFLLMKNTDTDQLINKFSS